MSPEENKYLDLINKYMEIEQEILHLGKKFTFEKAKSLSKKAKFLYRYKNIINLWNNDPTQTLLSVASLFNVSKERIRQILKTAKLFGREIRPSSDRTKHFETKQIETVKAEVFHALENIYGTLEYPAWKRQFLQKATPPQSSFFRKELKKRWKNGTLDPLLHYTVDILLKDKHYKILEYRKMGKTIDEIVMIMNLSKPSITNYIRDLKMAGLYTNVNQNQIEAISLNDELVQERLNKVRDDLIAGQKISKINVGNTDAAHFIRTHFLKSYYHEQNKKNERRTND